MRSTPTLPQVTLLALLLGCGMGAVGAGAVVESQPTIPGQRATTAEGSSNNNSDGLLLLLEQNRNLQAEVQALRALVEEQGYEVRKLQRESIDRYTDMDSRLGSLESALASGASPAVSASTIAVEPARPLVLNSNEINASQVAANSSVARASAAGNSSPERTTTTDTIPSRTSGAASPSRPLVVSPAVEQRDIPVNVTTPQAAVEIANSNSAVARNNITRPGLEPVVLSEQQLYQMAYDSAINSQFDRAIAEFDQYLSLYPAGRFTTNAHYWKGQAYLYLNRYADAIASYNIILEQYSDSAKIPDAIYGLGVAYEGMGNTQRARQMFREIISKYPNTGVANLADTRLLSLN